MLGLGLGSKGWEDYDDDFHHHFQPQEIEVEVVFFIFLHAVFRVQLDLLGIWSLRMLKLGPSSSGGLA